MDKKKANPGIFEDIRGDSEPTVIESVCVNCFQNGETIIMMTKIPFFKEIVITSFKCENCGFKNNEVQFAGELPDFGVDILFRVMKPEDLNRELVKSEFSKIYIEELDLEIPENKKAEITTIEGLLMRVEDELSGDQEQRKEKNPEQYTQIEGFLQRLREYKEGKKLPLTIKVRDPSGNANIKNPYAPKQDKNLQITNIARSLDELVQMGYSIENAREELRQIDEKKIGNKMNFTKPFEQSEFMKYQPVIFEVPCHSCQTVGQMKMCQTSVPYFTDLIIMSFVCEFCGAHSTQTKNSGEISEKGLIITLKVESDEDLKRDLFKSQTCAIALPELDIELDYGTLGGVFTTVEGLIEKIQDNLDERNPFADSDGEFYARMKSLLEDLASFRNGGRKFTMILRDPLAHSFLQNPYHPNEDPRATREFVERTQDENETLGLNDIKVENYQLSPSKSEGMKKRQRKVSEGEIITTPEKKEESH